MDNEDKLISSIESAQSILSPKNIKPLADQLFSLYCQMYRSSNGEIVESDNKKRTLYELRQGEAERWLEELSPIYENGASDIASKMPPHTFALGKFLYEELKKPRDKNWVHDAALYYAGCKGLLHPVVIETPEWPDYSIPTTEMLQTIAGAYLGSTKRNWGFVDVERKSCIRAALTTLDAMDAFLRNITESQLAGDVPLRAMLPSLYNQRISFIPRICATNETEVTAPPKNGTPYYHLSDAVYCIQEDSIEIPPKLLKLSEAWESIQDAASDRSCYKAISEYYKPELLSSRDAAKEVQLNCTVSNRSGLSTNVRRLLGIDTSGAATPDSLYITLQNKHEGRSLRNVITLYDFTIRLSNRNGKDIETAWNIARGLKSGSDMQFIETPWEEVCFDAKEIADDFKKAIKAVPLIPLDYFSPNSDSAMKMRDNMVADLETFCTSLQNTDLLNKVQKIRILIGDEPPPTKPIDLPPLTPIVRTDELKSAKKDIVT